MPIESKTPNGAPVPVEWCCVLLDHVPAVAAYWDADLHCLFANSTHKTWFGISPNEIVGKHMADLHGQLYPVRARDAEAALRGKPQRFTHLIPDLAGGAPRYSVVSYIPHVVDGGVRGVFVLATDVTEARRAEISLSESEERFRLALEGAPIGMAVLDTEGRFLRVNHALCAILGYAADELVGMPFQSVTHPDDVDRDGDLAARLARGEIPRYSPRKRYVRKDGRVVHAELSASVVRSADGRPREFIAEIVDITNRKRTESEQQFLAELGPVLASTLNPEEVLDRVVALVTARIADACVIDTSDVVSEDGTLLRKRIAGRAGKKWLAEGLLRLQLDCTKPYLLREAIRTRAPVLMQQPTPDDLAALAQGPEHLRLLQQMEIASILSVPMIAGDRLIGGIALIATRGSREYDDRDTRLAQELAWRIAISMDNARLYAAARQAIKLREEVLALVAHDLRNPLSTIVMQAALLGRRAQDRDHSNALAGDTIARAAARMRRLIDDLLDVSRMEAGRLALQRAALDPALLLHHSVESQRHLAEAASIDLRLQTSGGLPPLWADRDRLLQVFENLIGNALKFSGRGGRITVGADLGEDEVLFFVRDTGAGIPPDHLPQLFDRFWQARRVEGEGAGLGLYISKGIVEAHGGRIWVETTPGVGSCFFFTIPTADRGLSHVSS